MNQKKEVEAEFVAYMLEALELLQTGDLDGEFHWWAADSNGEVAAFNTCGISRPVSFFLERKELYRELAQDVASRLIGRGLDPNDPRKSWQYAEGGFYWYEPKDAFSSGDLMMERRSVPTVPLKLEELGEGSRDTISHLGIVAGAFSKLSRIDLRETWKLL